MNKKCIVLDFNFFHKKKNDAKVKACISNGYAISVINSLIDDKPVYYSSKPFRVLINNSKAIHYYTEGSNVSLISNGEALLGFARMYRYNFSLDDGRFRFVFENSDVFEVFYSLDDDTARTLKQCFITQSTVNNVVYAERFNLLKTNFNNREGE